MGKSAQVASSLPDQVRRGLIDLGQGIRQARQRRRIPQTLMAERMLVSRQTLQRLESGDPTVGLAVLASALFVLGLAPRLSDLAAPDRDMAALGADLARLPSRTHRPSRAMDDLDF